MTIEVRPFRLADAAAVAEVERAAFPFVLCTERTVRYWTGNAPARQHLRRFVAESDGWVVGTASAGLNPESGDAGEATAEVRVRPEHRGRGVGTALAKAGQGHVDELGARTVRSWVRSDDRSVAFAESFGCHRSVAGRILHLDLSSARLPQSPAVPRGVELVTAAEFAADPRRMYGLDEAVVVDEPTDLGEPVGMDYREWLTAHWEAPDVNLVLTSVAVVGGEPVAFSFSRTDGESLLVSGMTGTLARWRGRGLAKLVKHHTLVRAAAAGYASAFTGNDSTNEPMLAINEWLGYRHWGTEYRYVRGASSAVSGG